MMANLVKKESNIQKVIGDRAESAPPDRNRTKNIPGFEKSHGHGIYHFKT